ncbi:Thyroid hormone receptor-associated coactivator complex component (TRAP170) [Handroanthus impetiginosus]|uniref:Mediator of RNA polymerase II transcription subunit 14 n=1 Tax=Handroanthus impetiginosus TaxID=429701 RepID=A0A2G9IA08_9LAMI|nr:Thyroid hormone receptor-associated coactivator complex component (TRAP170) [Handroanthus impetiginosus]
MAEVGQETLDFGALVARAAEESYVSLKELVEKSKSSESLSDSEKKIMILKYIVKTQQRMLRLNVLAKWCQQVPLIQYCQQLASTLSSHDTCFTQAADSMFFMHEGLQQARAPIYDVPSAIEVLLTGSYQRLPKCIEDVGTQSTLNEDQQGPALKKLDMLVRSKLLEVSLPKEFTEIKASDGVVLLRVDGEFKVLVTLGYRGHLSMWRILHLELLVGERNGLVKVEESRRHVLGDDLERRMAASENPFVTLYSILHELCVALIMDTVIRQVKALRQGRWKDAIRFELISDGTSGQGGSAASSHGTQDGEIDSAGLRTPGLKVIYWLDLDRGTGAPDVGASPFLKIEPAPDLQIKCSHSTFVIDPLTGKEADFTLNRSCIDVEMLLLRAIGCNRYTRLLEIYKELEKNAQINRTPDDVQLQFHLDDYETDYEKRDNVFALQKHDDQEVLRVRAYGASFFTLGINIRNGRFLLRSPKNIISSKALLECEEALNQGSINAVKAFIDLRRNSVLHLFACIGRFLGLEVFEHGYTAAKLPKNISDDSNSLLMGFPECGSSYFLLMQLDKEFKPCPKLIEAQVDSSGKAEPFGDISKVIRVKNLDISRMHMCEDELNLSLLDCRKMLSNSNDVNINGNSESGHPSNSSLEGSMRRSNIPINFSSIVDEVFELEKDSNGQSASSTYGLSSASHFGLGTVNLHGAKPSSPSPNWEGAQTSQNALSNFKSSMQSGSTNSLASTLAKSQAVKKLTASKSDQDLPALRSPHSGGFGSYGIMDEDQLTVSGLPSARLLSPPQRIGPPAVSVKSEPKNLPAGPVSGSNSWVPSPSSSTLDSAALENSNQESIPQNLQNNGRTRKRTVSDMFKSLPSLHYLKANETSNKRRKIKGGPHPQLPSTRLLISHDHPIGTEGHSFANLIAEANKGNASPSIYVSVLLHIVRHCSLCIKHGRLTSQMEALDIPYVEEVGLRSASSNLWFSLPFSRADTWQHICLRLGRPGSLEWDVKIIDPHYKDLWELQKGSNNTPWGSGVRIANTSDVDSHIRYDSEGVVLSYNSVEADSIKKLVADIQRLSNARTFALRMRKLLGARTDEKLDESNASIDSRAPSGLKTVEGSEKFSEQMRRAFRIEAVGLMSLWFSFGSGVLARFVVEWESGKEGCRMHVSPDQLWPHTKFLEDFINGGEVASLLDCIRLTAGPLHALAAATRPARAAPVSGVPGITASMPSTLKQTGYVPSPGLPSNSNATTSQASSGPGGNPGVSTPSGPPGTHNTAAVLAAAAAAGRGGPGIVPSSLLPIDVSVVLRGPYWIRIIYRKNFAVDMRCFAGDQVWLQPATPPKVGPPTGGSLPCPQFRPFIMEHVAQDLNGIDSSFPGAPQALGMSNSNNPNPSSAPQLPATPGNRANIANGAAMSRTGNAITALNRIGNALPGSSNLPAVNPLRRPPGSGVPAHVRGELNTAIIGLGDDGGYGGGWVPLVALKKVLRGILKYLGVLWLFAQLPDLLKEILGSILKDNEGALLNLDQEQPALRFFVGGYVFAVSVHRVQLLLQVLSVKRFHHSQQQQQNSATAQEELTQAEIGEICDYFSRRVASEPYDASRVASFITLLTLPISVLREFLKLIAWKKGLAQVQGADAAAAPAQKSRIELCLENHMGFNRDGTAENSSVSKSNIHYDRAHNSVDFALTVVLDPAHIPHINAAGGAAWLPYCVSIRLRYSFGENPTVSFLGMEGSHGGRACWLRVDDWNKCKQRVARTVEVNGSSGGDTNQGRLRVVADSVQRTLHTCLQELRDGIGMT